MDVDEIETESERPQRRHKRRQRSGKKYASASYTVGWIAALKHELTAGIAMLDERHAEPDDFDRHINDSNTYHYGRIGAHNVVITSLGKPYGTLSAATTAAEMSISHPHIRFGLLVGIGAGVPRPKHDIRLGDVVVSEPEGTSGGVVQYDLVKAKVGGSELTGLLVPPPLVLQKAVIALASDHILQGSEVSAIMDAAFDKHPELARDPLWKYQGWENDRLHRETFERVGDFNNAKDRAYLHNDFVMRTQRSSTTPRIHYGVIGSGNTLVKDVDQREAILKLLPEECLCLEMEAAGLMNTFPCLVVRGICDYGDAMKNDDWQHHAAFTAAAYTKELLESMISREISKVPKVVDAMSDTIERIESDTAKLVEQALLEHKQAIIKWLYPADHSALLNANLQAHLHGTGDWFLHSPTFNGWLASPESGVLFCSGIPGAGKSILASVVVGHLLRTVHCAERPVAYLFFDYRQPASQELEICLANLLSQLAMVNPLIQKILYGLYGAHSPNQTRPLRHELEKALEDAYGLVREVVVVVDALDECSGTICEDIVAILKRLRANKSSKILFTSRPIPRILDLFTADVWLRIHASAQDIAQYVQSRIPSLPNCIRKSEDMSREIQAAVVHAADGVFLLAKLHVDSMRDCLTQNDIDIVLQRMLSDAQTASGHSDEGSPERAYDNAYKIALGRVFDQRHRAHSLLRRLFELVAFSKRPLYKEQIQEALAVYPQKTTLDPRDLPDVDELLSYCAGLILAVPSRRIYCRHIHRSTTEISLAHFTLQEYLNRRRASYFPEADFNLAQCCITYLATDTFLPSNFRRLVFGAQAWPGPLIWDQLHPFYLYAQQHWQAHVKDLSAHASGAAMNLLEEPVLRYFREAVVLSAESLGRFYVHRDDLKWETLYQVAAEADCPFLTAAAQRSLSLLRPPAESDGVLAEIDCSFRLAFREAAANGYEDYVKIILERFPTANYAWKATITMSFLKALDNTSNNIAELLVPWIDPEWRFEGGRSALSHAAEAKYATQQSHLDGSTARIVSLLLSISDPNARDDLGRIPLHFAADRGHAAIVSVLLNDSNRNQSDGLTGMTPLHYAARNGHGHSVSLLAPHSDCNARDISRRTALHWATQQNHMEVASVLLPYTDCNAKDDTGSTPLHCATLNGCEELVSLLLRQSDCNAKDNSDRIPMHWAALNKSSEIVSLLPPFSDCTARDRFGRTALHLAVAENSAGIVSMLLHHSDCNAKDNVGRTPLHLAARSYKRVADIAQLLLPYSDCNITDNDGRTPLHIAALHYNEPIVRLLLPYSNRDTMDNAGQTPLQSSLLKRLADPQQASRISPVSRPAPSYYQRFASWRSGIRSIGFTGSKARRRLVATGA